MKREYTVVSLVGRECLLQCKVIENKTRLMLCYGSGPLSQVSCLCRCCGNYSPQVMNCCYNYLDISRTDYHYHYSHCSHCESCDKQLLDHNVQATRLLVIQVSCVTHVTSIHLKVPSFMCL